MQDSITEPCLYEASALPLDHMLTSLVLLYAVAVCYYCIVVAVADTVVCCYYFFFLNFFLLLYDYCYVFIYLCYFSLFSSTLQPPVVVLPPLVFSFSHHSLTSRVFPDRIFVYSFLANVSFSGLPCIISPPPPHPSLYSLMSSQGLSSLVCF